MTGSHKPISTPHFAFTATNVITVMRTPSALDELARPYLAPCQCWAVLLAVVVEPLSFMKSERVATDISRRGGHGAANSAGREEIRYQ